MIWRQSLSRRAVLPAPRTAGTATDVAVDQCSDVMDKPVDVGVAESSGWVEGQGRGGIVEPGIDPIEQ